MMPSLGGQISYPGESAMGIDDRDYMRPNQNRWNSKRWNHRKARKRTTMINVNLAGRVAKDLEVRNNVTTLIVATDSVKLKDGKTYIDEETGYTAKETEFHKITCFNGLGKGAATRDKGDVVAITGRIHYSSWTDRDGTIRYGCEIIADKIDFF